jgi:hypothetical protein
LKEGLFGKKRDAKQLEVGPVEAVCGLLKE